MTGDKHTGATKIIAHNNKSITLCQQVSSVQVDNDGTPTNSVDFTKVMFLSTGGATVAAKKNQKQSDTGATTQLVQGGTATWQEYKGYAKRLFWIWIFPICTAVYLSIALVVYFATVYNWTCKDNLALPLVVVAGLVSLLVTLWTGSVAYRLSNDRIMVNRGLVYVFQVHAAALLSIPILCAYVLMDAHLFTPNTVVRSLMGLYLSLCTFLLLSALLARQKQMVELFSEYEFTDAPKNTYRDTVMCIGAIYVAANVAHLVLILLTVDPDYRYAPISLVNIFCLLLWFYYAYQSRHASAQFSDFDQLRRLFVLITTTLVVTAAWGYVEREAFIMQNLLVFGLMSVFLLDSYLSLFEFIRDELDPQCAREVAFAHHPDRSSSPIKVTTTVACVLPNQYASPNFAVVDSSGTSNISPITKSTADSPSKCTRQPTVNIDTGTKLSLSENLSVLQL